MYRRHPHGERAVWRTTWKRKRHRGKQVDRGGDAGVGCSRGSTPEQSPERKIGVNHTTKGERRSKDGSDALR
jgi:hypothetical protein